MYIKLFKKIISIVFLLSITSISSAKNLGSIAASRFGTLYTLDGGLLSNARAKLLNPSNFGPGGTVSKRTNNYHRCSSSYHTTITSNL